MFKTSTINSDNKVLVDITGLQAMLSIGKNTAAKIGKEAGAIVKIGRRTLYNTRKIQQYIDNNDNIAIGSGTEV